MVASVFFKVGALLTQVWVDYGSQALCENVSGWRLQQGCDNLTPTLAPLSLFATVLTFLYTFAVNNALSARFLEQYGTLQKCH